MIQTISIALISFITGVSVGIIIRPYLTNQEKLVFQVKDLVAVVLMALLCISILAEIFTSYQVSPFLYGLVGTVVGGFYGPDILSKTKK